MSGSPDRQPGILGADRGHRLAGRDDVPEGGVRNEVGVLDEVGLLRATGYGIIDQPHRWVVARGPRSEGAAGRQPTTRSANPPLNGSVLPLVVDHHERLPFLRAG